MTDLYVHAERSRRPLVVELELAGLVGGLEHGRGQRGGGGVVARATWHVHEVARRGLRGVVGAEPVRHVGRAYDGGQEDKLIISTKFVTILYG